MSEGTQAKINRRRKRVRDRLSTSCLPQRRRRRGTGLRFPEPDERGKSRCPACGRAVKVEDEI